MVASIGFRGMKKSNRTFLNIEKHIRMRARGVKYLKYRADVDFTESSELNHALKRVCTCVCAHVYNQPL